MRPTKAWALALLALVAGAVAYVLTVNFYADVQSPPGLAPVWLLLLALAELYTASMTRARLSGRPGTKPINAIVVARLAALAKGTSPVGALATGAYAGFLGYVARTSTPAAHTDTRTAVIGTACSLALTAAALMLERVCRAKPPTDPPELDG